MSDTEKLQAGELKQGESLVKFWQAEIDLARNWRDKWLDKAQQVYKIYRDDRDFTKANSKKKVNLYWSSLQTMMPSIFTSVPKVDCRRRNADRDKIKRISAEILERATEYSVECHQDYFNVVTNALNDFLVAGRGVLWERYEFQKEKTLQRVVIMPEELQSGVSQALNRPIKPEEVQTDEQGSFVMEPTEKITYQKSITDYVPFDDFFYNPARTLDEVRWKARRHYFTRKELERYWPDIAGEVDLTKEPDGLSSLKLDKEEQKRYKKAEVFEIWNLEDKRVYYISPGYDAGALEIKDDPLGLEKFFPCNEVFDFITPQELLPTPEYCMAQDQLEEINSLTDRIDALVRIIRANGVCPAEFKEQLAQILSGDNILAGLTNFVAFNQAGGTNIIQFLPLEQFIQVLQQLLQAREMAKQLYYEVTRQSDLMRGASNPLETASAQNLKSDYADVTQESKRRKFEKFLRDAIRIKAEIIAEQFEPEILFAMTGMNGFSEQVTQQDFFAAIQLLKDDTMRDYAINIETDSTIISDERKNKQNVSEFIGSITPYLGQTMESLRQAPELAPAFIEMLMMFMRSFKISSGVEDSIEMGLRDLLEKQKQLAKQPPPPPPQDPMVVQLQNQAAIEHEKNVFQLEQKKVEATQKDKDIFRQQAETISNATLEQARIQIEREKVLLQAEKQRHDFWLAIEDLKIKADEVQKTELAALAAKASADSEPIGDEIEQSPPEPKPALPEPQPIHVHVNMPQSGSKIARFRTGPTGEREAIIEDAQPQAGVV